MMAQPERETNNPENVLAEIAHVNQLIRQTRQGKSSSQLGLSEKEQLKNLNRKKAQLLVRALLLRKEGRLKIKVIIYGKPEEELNPFAYNKLVFSFSHPTKRTPIETTSYLNTLRQEFLGKGDIGELIGEPDEIIEESPQDYALRTIREINEVSLRREQEPNLSKSQSLNQLKVELAERVLKLRADGFLDSSQLKISLLVGRYQKDNRADLIDVLFNFGQSRKAGFYLLSPDRYLFPNNLDQLIKKCGGYDEETFRKQ